MERYVSSSTSVNQGNTNSIPNGDFPQHIPPPHIDPIWPPHMRCHAQKKKNLGRLIRSRILLFKFIRAISPAPISIRALCSREEEDKWLKSENVLTLIEKTSEEKQKKLQRIKEIQKEAYMKGRHNKHLIVRRTDFNLPYYWHEHDGMETRQRQYDVFNCDEIFRSSSSEIESNQKLIKNSANVFEKDGETSLVSVKLPPICGATSREFMENTRGEFLEKPSEDPRFQSLLSVLVPLR